MLNFNYFSLSLFLGGVFSFLSAAIIYFHNAEKQNRVWFFLNISIAVWSFGYFFMITATSHNTALIFNWILHGAAILIPLLYFLFVLYLTDTYDRYKFCFYFCIALALIFEALNPTTLFVRDVIPKFIFNYVCDAGPAYIYFTIYFFALNIFTEIVLLYSISNAPNQLEILRRKYIFWASVVGYSGGATVFFLTFNINIPPYTIILFSVYPIVITYAILKHNLFNIRLISTEFFVGSLWLVILFKVVISTSLIDQITDMLLLGVSVIIGIFLVKSMQKELIQREKIEKQEKQLEIANKEQENLIHIINHQIKGYLTKAG